MKIWTTSTADTVPVQRTKTHDNGGASAKWNETFTLPIKDTTEHFYVEVMDTNDITADRYIGKAKFACSDLSATVVEAWIRIYRDDGMDAGEVLIAAHIE